METLLSTLRSTSEVDVTPEISRKANPQLADLVPNFAEQIAAATQLHLIGSRPAVSDDDLLERRNWLICELLFAARSLATFQLRYHIHCGDRSGRAICEECRIEQLPDIPLEKLHAEHCRTGRVLQILAQLEGLASYWPESIFEITFEDGKGGS